MGGRRGGNSRTQRSRRTRGDSLNQHRSWPHIFTTAAVPERGAALDVCVSSSNAVAARGDAAQATFEKKTRVRRQIQQLRELGIAYKPIVTADGQPRPIVTRTMQHAASIAACRNGQQQSAALLKHRWKHEVQIAQLQRQAAMTSAALPDRRRAKNGCSTDLWTEPPVTGHPRSMATTTVTRDGIHSTGRWQHYFRH